jgi:hypothetical protein
MTRTGRFEPSPRERILLRGGVWEKKNLFEESPSNSFRI